MIGRTRHDKLSAPRWGPYEGCQVSASIFLCFHKCGPASRSGAEVSPAREWPSQVRTETVKDFGEGGWESDLKGFVLQGGLPY
jgi:hypothetical protein